MEVDTGKLITHVQPGRRAPAAGPDPAAERAQLASWKMSRSENKSSIIHCKNFYCYPLLTEGENCEN